VDLSLNKDFECEALDMAMCCRGTLYQLDISGTITDERYSISSSIYIDHGYWRYGCGYHGNSP